MTVDSRQMRLHIATHHGLSMDEYNKQHGSAEIVTRKFRCEFCNSEMKFCRQNIYAHMKDVHKISLKDYEARIGIQAGDILPVEDQIENGTMPITPSGGRRSKKSKASTLLPIVADEESEEIVLEGIDPTIAMMPTTVMQSNDDYIDSGVLDDGKKPSRWNKCRFRCAICGKLSSEKRHVREHIIKFHSLSLPEYEAQYGDCEIHTEYFFCGVCHAEVKHNLKNISLHLQNVHAMSPAQYEQQYGTIPEDEDQNIHLGAEVNNDVQDYGFGGGGHFLLDDNNVETYDDPMYEKPMIVDIPNSKSLANPPKVDIVNPKNKYCKTCNRDFNRRQAFVEHCRTVHGMKIRFAKATSAATVINSKSFNSPSGSTPKAAPTSTSTSPATPTANNGSPASGYPCQYCGKLFSNQSNRRRHAVLSCEMARNAGVEPRKSRELTKPVTKPLNEDFYYEDGPPMNKHSNQNCPFDNCDEGPFRSALLKRHLLEKHNVKDGEVPAESVKSEIEQHDENVEDDRKVPPLRVKISKQIADKGDGPKKSGPKELKPFVTCDLCNEFKSNNLYILGRHKKSCEKKIEAKEAKQLELTLEEDSNDNADEDNDATIVEVPVDFAETNDDEQDSKSEIEKITDSSEGNSQNESAENEDVKDEEEAPEEVHDTALDEGELEIKDEKLDESNENMEVDEQQNDDEKKNDSKTDDVNEEKDAEKNDTKE